MNIIQDHTLLREIGTLPEYASENDTCFGRGDFDRRFDALEAVRGDCVDRGAFDDLEVAEGGKVEAEVLECVWGLIDEEDI